MAKCFDMIRIMSAELIDAFKILAKETVRREAGECLFRRDDPVTSVFLLLSGRVHLVRYHENGKMLTLHQAVGPTIIAEASVYSDHYHCDAVCIEDSVLLRAARSALRGQLTTDPTLATAWATHLAWALQAARTRSELLTTKGIAERLDSWLSLNGGVIPARGQRKALAAELGVTPEALYRELAKRNIDR